MEAEVVNVFVVVFIFVVGGGGGTEGEIKKGRTEER